MPVFELWMETEGTPCRHRENNTEITQLAVLTSVSSFYEHKQFNLISFQITQRTPASSNTTHLLDDFNRC